MLKLESITTEDGAIQAANAPARSRVVCLGGEFFALEHGEQAPEPVDA